MDSLPLDPAPPPPGERTSTDSTETVKFREFEEVLARLHGERFRSYRRDYRRSLAYDANGFLPDFPITVTAELVNRCNLRCVMCYTVNHGEARASLGLTELAPVLDECRREGLPAFVVGLGSEPLLHKELREVLLAVKQAGVMDIFLGSNGVLFDEDLSEFVVEHQIARVEVSIDAATPETYQAIRGRDEYERVVQNVRKLLEVRKRRGSDLPVVRLCFCVQERNRHERRAFLDLWEGEVDYVDFQEKIDFDDIDELRERGTTETVDQLVVDEPRCAYPFNSLNVWADGDVTPCCTFFARAPELRLGNIETHTLKEIWQGEKIAEIRRQILTGELNPTCKTCLGRRDEESFEAVRTANREDGLTV